VSGKILLAALVGAILMYVWSSGAHMSPLAMIGIKSMPNEGPALSALTQATGDKPGLYHFPYADAKSKTFMKDMETAMKTKPSGILVYRPAGAPMMTPTQLIGEFVLELFETLLAVWLLTRTGASSFGARVGVMAGIGVLAAVVTNMSYWIWYAYPLDYTLANMVIEFGKFLFAGVGAAFILGMKPKAAAA
jgi:hypothetical protein